MNQIFEGFIDTLLPHLKSSSRPTLDVATRWNSTFLMIQSCNPYRSAFNSFTASQNDMLPITEEEWNVATQIQDMLKPLYDATISLSARNSPTIHLVYVHVFAIKRHIAVYQNHSIYTLKLAANKMMDKYNKYFDSDSTFHVVAHILDPRSKISFISRHRDLTAVGEKRLQFVTFFNNYYKIEKPNPIQETEVVTNHALNDYDSLMMDASKRRRLNDEPTVKCEAERYLDASPIEFQRDLDILSWWKYQSENFPDLSRMAKDILAIPATSVPSESAFSTSGRIVDDFRSCLNSSTVEVLLLGRNWLEQGIRSGS